MTKKGESKRGQPCPVCLEYGQERAIKYGTMCNTHNQMARDGKPLVKLYPPTPRKKRGQEPLDVRLDRYTDKTPYGPHGCWAWTGKFVAEYPNMSFYYNGVQNAYAHRAAFLVANGYLPRNRAEGVIGHTCGNGRRRDGVGGGCVNPAHLFLQSNHDNNIEMLERNAYIRRIAEQSAAVRALADVVMAAGLVVPDDVVAMLAAAGYGDAVGVSA